MGKQKSTAKPAPRRNQEKLATEFPCPFCNYNKSVVCLMDCKETIGTVYCRICMEKFGTHIDSLSAPIDVYGEWIDECELAIGPVSPKQTWGLVIRA